jgi:hypothetical protein
VVGRIRVSLIIRMACFALILFFVRVQVWFVLMDEKGETSYQRGFFAPSLFAFAAVLGFSSTFDNWSPRPLTRSEKFMANVRRGNRKDHSEQLNVIFALVTTVISVGGFAASFFL